MIIVSQVFYLCSQFRKKKIWKKGQKQVILTENMHGGCHITGTLTWTEGTSVKAFIKSSSSTAPAPPSLEAPDN